MLTNYVGYFSEYIDGSYYGENSKDLNFKHGLACFVKKNLKQSFVGDAKLHDVEKKWNDYSGRFAGGAIQIILVEDYAIANAHGLWQQSIKGDTEAKLAQSKTIIDLMKKVKGKKIVCGDFNLLPDTRSIQLLRDEYKDLIYDYKIESTRSSLYTKELRYADYIFMDKDILINSFSVPNLEISDHLPLILEFDNK